MSIGEMTSHVQIVSPEVARSWLDLSGGNRNLSKGHVLRLAADMKEGRWYLNPQPICFSSSGALIDGHHRLEAVVASGCATEFMVTRGVPDLARSVIDKGRRRSVADQLNLAGHPQATAVAAAARIVMMYDRVPGLVWSGGTMSQLSEVEIEQCVQSHDGYWRSLDASTARLIGRYTSLTTSSWLALEYLVGRDSTNLDLWADFSRGVVTGEMLQVGDPRYTLRNQRFRVRWGSNQQLLFAGILAWNAWVTGRHMEVIHVRQAQLPLPGIR